MTPNAPVTGVILAGGQGRRMGGADKGLMRLHGRPLVAHVLERLAPQVAEVLISANRNEGVYASLGCRVIRDGLGDFAGPLAGLHAAMGAASCEYVATVPCDSPGLPRDLVVRLWEGRRMAHADVAVVRAAGRTHPVFFLGPASLRPRLEHYLEGGERKVSGWLESLRVAEVPFDDEAVAFANLNTLLDLAQREAEDDG